MELNGLLLVVSMYLGLYWRSGLIGLIFKFQQPVEESRSLSRGLEICTYIQGQYLVTACPLEMRSTKLL
jgi:hypothetical protein